MGKGDRTKFFDFLLKSNPTQFPDLGKKIRLITATKIGPHEVYNDKNCAPERLNKHTIFKIWLHTVRRHNCVTLKQLIDAYPYQQDNLKLWDNFVDADGKTTLNPEQYKEFRAQKKVEAEKNKKKTNAKKGRQGKM
jgi:hypothetical protein